MRAAIKKMRIKNPVSQIITWGGTQFKIVGVVKDALMNSPFTGADPLCLSVTRNRKT